MLGSVALITVLVLGVPSLADTLYVSPGGSHDPPFTNYATASTNIQDAIDLARADDTVLLQASSYNLDYTLTITNAITVSGDGGYAYLSGPYHRSGTYIHGIEVEDPGAKLVLLYLQSYGGPDMEGGAIYMDAAATVSNCYIGGSYALRGGGAFVAPSAAGATFLNTRFNYNRAYDSGGGLYLAASSMVYSCEIANGYTYTNGGGIWAGEPVLLRNSCIRDNNYSGQQTRGGGVYCTNGASIESCTIVRNSSALTGGGLYATGTTVNVRNTILWNNSAASSPNYDVDQAYFAHCCTLPLPQGTNNITDDPLLPVSGAPSPDFDSPVVNAGTNAPWMSTAMSYYDSVPRIYRDVVDIGAYEVPFGCDFTANVTEGFPPLEVIFTARVYGGNSNDIEYSWNFYAAGSAYGDGLYTVTNVYNASGTYNVMLVVQGQEAADYSMKQRISYIRVGPQYVYVSTNGSHTSPYTNWTDAATNVAPAVAQAVAGTTVFVSNGHYRLTSPVAVSRPITIQGVGTETGTILDGRGVIRCMQTTVPGVTLKRLTFTGGQTSSYPGGGAIYMQQGGTIQDCLITNNHVTASGGGIAGAGTTALEVVSCRIEDNTCTLYGGGVYGQGALMISNSIVSTNTCGYSGGGVYVNAGGVVHGCTVANNTASQYGGGLSGTGSGTLLVRSCSIVSNNAATQGGGIYLTGSASAEDCTIQHNTAGQQGGGAHIWLTTLSRCRILDNQCLSMYGGGVSAAPGTLQNCLVARNRSASDGGGLYTGFGAKIESCTVAYNRAASRGGGTWGANSTMHTNNIFFGNQAISELDVGHQTAGSMTYTHCLTTRNLLSGTGNVAGDPLFAEPTQGDFRIRYGSVAIDAGTNQPWMATGSDLAGDSRTNGPAVDIGALEFDGVPLGTAFTASPAVGYAPLTVTFNAQVFRENPTPVTCFWDFDNNGTVDAQGVELLTVSNTYAAPGNYDVRLTVSNALGQVDTGVKPDCVGVWPPPTTHYVDDGGSHDPPFTNWATAATNIQAALDVVDDGGIVLLAAGTHANAETPVITSAITLAGTTAKSLDTIISGAGARRGLVLANSHATVKDLVVESGDVNYYGGGIFAPQGGTISNCLIRNSYARLTTYPGPYGGGGVYLAHGLLVDSRLEENRADHAGGGALLVEDATARGCQFVTNTASSGGGVGLWGGHVDDCLMASNNAGMGGGAYFSSGTLAASELSYNRASSQGGGVYVGGAGTVERCTISANSSHTGGGVNMALVEDTSVLRSCLVTGNSASSDGGGVQIRAGHIESCTIASNRCPSDAGGVGYYLYDYYPRRIVNSIIYHNTGAPGSNNHSFASFSEVDMDHVCTTRIPSGTPTDRNNITADPQFPDVKGISYEIGSDSPCFNAGLNEAWMDGAEDVDAGPRVAYGQVDIGAYESSAPTIVPDFAGTPRDGRIPLEVSFQGSFVGVGATGTVYFAWDFDNDGTVDQSGVGLHSVNHTYTSTLYHTVSLYVSNTVAGLTNVETKVDYIRARPQAVIHYVATNGNHNAPFTNWLGAATNPAAAIAVGADFDQVVIGPGVYPLYQTLKITNEIDVIGDSGAAATVFDGHGAVRCIEMAAAGATLQELTVQNGYLSNTNDGAGVLMSASGVVSRCIVSANQGRHGAGVYATNGGWIVDSLVVSNTCLGNGAYGGGVYAGPGVRVERCQLRRNYAAYGGGVAVPSGGEVLNSIMTDNTAAFGGGAWLRTGGSIRSCTIAANRADQQGGLYSYSDWIEGAYVFGLIVNSIIYDNISLYGGVGVDVGGYVDDALFDHVCVGDMVMTGLSGTGLVIGNPNLTDPAALDLDLMPGSVAIDAGMHEDWMDGAVDVEGKPRIRNAAVDLGALEFDPDPFQCWFSRSQTNGWTPLSVNYQAYVSGSNTTGLVYYWDVDGNSSTDYSGDTLDNLAVLYDIPGDYSAKLVVSNAAGHSVEWQYSVPVHVAPGTIYVATNGASVYPYGAWSTAATNLHDAIAMIEGGTTVEVGDGTFTITNQLVLDCAVTLRSQRGWEHTAILQTETDRCLYMSNNNAVVEGFDISGGYLSDNGGGVYILRGAALRDCRIHDCTALKGGGIYNDSNYAVIERCIIENNTASAALPGGSPGGDGRGGGVYTLDGKVDRCIIRGNTAYSPMGTGNGGGILAAGSDPVIHNCLITSNTCNNSGGGVFVFKGDYHNCTIVENSDTGSFQPSGRPTVRPGG